MLQDYLRLVSSSILIIGPAKSGKTTILMRLKSGKFVKHIKPTIGFSSDFMKNTPVIEIGGQESYKKFTQKAINENPALTLFVIDISSESDIDEYKRFKESFKSLKQFLLIVNKIDLIEIRDHQVVGELQKEEVEVIFCSARTGENFWRLSETIAEFCSRYIQGKQNISVTSPNFKGQSMELIGKEDKKMALELLERYEGKF